MYIYVDSQDTVTDQMRELVLRRAHVATRRLSYAVSQAKVQLRTVFGLTGLMQRHCRVELTVGDAATVVATGHATEWRSALDVALRRAARALPGMQRRSRARLRQESSMISYR